LNDNKIEVSIVLPCFNSERTLKTTLESIVKQTFLNFELIIIDDGSIDASLEIMKNIQALSTCSIKIISRENKGFLYSLDEGIKSSIGRYIARIDHDDVWNNNHLECIMKAFNDDKNLVLVGSNAILINENGEEIGRTQQQVSEKIIIKNMLKDSPFIHSSVVFSRKVYDLTPGYLIGTDEGSRHIADYNLWFELSKQGKCKNIIDYTVLYRVLEDSMSRQMDKCINYRARLSVMKDVYKHYKKFHFYYYFQTLKVGLRVFQYCHARKLFK
jgi:glycosyltransferase involved in cell wall biosynthesis